MSKNGLAGNGGYGYDECSGKSVDNTRNTKTTTKTTKPTRTPKEGDYYKNIQPKQPPVRDCSITC